MRIADHRVATVALCLWPLHAWSQPPVESRPADQRLQLIEQKVKLLEVLVNSPLAKGQTGSGDAEAVALLQRRRLLLDQARQALGAQQPDEAAKFLDEALARTSQAGRGAAGKGAELSEAAVQASLANLGEQIATYRGTLQTMAREGSSAAARALLATVDGLSVEAAKLVADGRNVEANRKMTEAYRRVVEGLSRLQAGQTVTLSLKFDSPAEEYAYEERRFQSNEMMVGMMLDEGRASGDRRRMVEEFAGEAKRMRSDAAALAAAGNHAAAVTVMEKAVVQLNRALQTMGVPVF